MSISGNIDAELELFPFIDDAPRLDEFIIGRGTLESTYFMQ